MEVFSNIGNRFELGEKLGEGGMGSVYRAKDRQTGQAVAVKSLKPEVVAHDPDIVERFVREGEALRQLNHPNIVKMLSAEQVDGVYYLVMEYISGGSLRDLLDKQSQLPIKRVVNIALDLADALTRAHRLNIIHRDIKPANVLLADDGTPRLTDFGVARIGEASRVTQTGAVVGTLTYLSPEILNGDVPDARADIWAFGVMLYEMLAGKSPFEEPQLAATLTAIMTRPVPDLEAVRPDVPVALVDLIYRMLDKDPNQRIPSVRLVGAELEAILSGTSTATGKVLSRGREPDAGRFDTTPPKVDLPRHNLPAQTTPFVGRESELDEITRWLHDPNTRLVTILGPGGMGKTRLALEVGQRALGGTFAEARRTSPQPDTLFENGVYFVSLAPLVSPDFIVSTIADALNFTFYGSQDPAAQLMDFLREKSLLLVMDNFEHIIAGAKIVADILQAAPSIKVLATSRERLNLRGETLFQIAGMAVPENETAQTIENYAAVKLFLQSARRVQPGFELTDADRANVAHITRLVQGMPLGIELAAAWVEMLPLDEIAKEIESSLDFLETEMRDVPERHRSMRAVFEYSWNLLSEDEREIFTKLSVFRGGFTREAAQAVAGAGLKPLTGLVNKSLLRRDSSGRYGIHELLRQYGEARLNERPDVAQTVRDLHSAYYAAFAAQQEPDLWSRNEKKALEAIETDIENVRAGLWWAIERGKFDLIDQALQALTLFFESRGWYKEATETFQELEKQLIHKVGEGDNVLLWRVRSRHAWLAVRIGLYDQSRELAQASLAIFRRLDLKREIGMTLDVLCYVAMMRGDYTQARQFGEDNLANAQEINDSRRKVGALANLGYALYLQGSYEEAKRLYREVMKLIDTQGSLSVLAAMANNLGEILHTLREEDEAKTLFERSLALNQEIGNRRGVAFALNNLSGIANNSGDFEESIRYSEDSLTIYREVGDRRGTADALMRLGNSAFTAADHPKAQRYLAEASTAYRQLGDRRGIANTLALAGFVSLLIGDFSQSLRYHEESLALRREMGNPEDIADSLNHMSLASWQSGNFQAALDYYEEGIAIIHQHGLTQSPAMSFLTTCRGMLAAEMGDYAAAKSYCELSLELLLKLGDRWGEGITLITLGDIYQGSGDPVQARQFYKRALRVALEIRGLVWITSSISGIAQLLAAEEHYERAVELAALTLYHPASWTPAKNRAKSCLADLETKLTPQVFAAAVTRGRARQPYPTAQELLTE